MMKFLEFLGPAAELDLAAVTRKMITEFRNHVAQKASATTTNHDLKAIKLLFRSARRDGYIIEDPSEFVESVRKTSDDPRRPFTVSEIRSVIDVADKEWRSLVLFGLYTGQRLADLATCAGTISTCRETKSESKPARPESDSRFQWRRRSKLTLKALLSVVTDVFTRRRRLQSQAKSAP